MRNSPNGHYFCHRTHNCRIKKREIETDIDQRSFPSTAKRRTCLTHMLFGMCPSLTIAKLAPFDELKHRKDLFAAPDAGIAESGSEVQKKRSI